MTKMKNRDEQFAAWKKCDLAEKIRHQKLISTV